MSIVAWICLGVLGGALVGWLTGSHGRALLSSSVVGGIGAVIGGFLAAAMLGLDITGIDTTSVLVAGVGALALVLFERAIPATDVFE
jgi:uncharacterized membrane protein YeaQ/YmgE (transglycosylase-associated protein family)